MNTAKSSIEASAVRRGLGAQTFLVSTFFFSISPLLPEIARTLGTSVYETAAITAYYAGGVAISTMATALGSDRMSAGRVFAAASLIHSAGLICAASAASMFQLGAGYLVAGLAAGMLQPTAYRAALEIPARSDRGKWLGALTAGSAFAMIAGAPLAAWSTSAIGWRTLLFSLALLWLPILVLLRPMLLKSRASSRSARRLTLSSQEILVYVTTAIAGAGFHGTFPLIGTALADSVANTNLPPGTAFLCFGVGAFGASTMIGRISKTAPEIVYPRCMALTGFVYICLPVAFQRDWSIVAVMLMWGFGQILGFAMLVMAIARRSEGRLGLAMGLSAACMMGGAVLGSIAGLAAFGAGGFALLCLCGAACTLLSLIPMAWVPLTLEAPGAQSKESGFERETDPRPT